MRHANSLRQLYDLPSISCFLHQFFFCCFKLLYMECNITTVSALYPRDESIYSCPLCIEKSSYVNRINNYHLYFELSKREY